MLFGDNGDPVFLACWEDYSHSSDDSHAAKISALATQKECTLSRSPSARPPAGQQDDPAHRRRGSILETFCSATGEEHWAG